MQPGLPGGIVPGWYQLVISEVDAAEGHIFIDLRIFNKQNPEGLVMWILRPEINLNNDGISLQKDGVDVPLFVNVVQPDRLIMVTDPGMFGEYILWVPPGIPEMSTRFGVTCLGMMQSVLT